MPNIFYVGVVVYVLLIITGVCTVVYLLTSPRKKERAHTVYRHLRRRGDVSKRREIQELVRRYRNGGPKSTANHRG